jgi:hypothetical protein
MQSVLPPDVAAAYEEHARSALMRPALHVLMLNLLQPIPLPRVAGSRSEYVRLIGRMYAVGMSGFTATPRAVNGIFAVGKDADSDRVIIDARRGNRLFVDSPHVDLCGPSHLVQMHVPRGESMVVGKSDLSNFYHHLGLPSWMQPYFALPPLTPAELREIGAPPGAAFPMCLTLPMGFSHAVYLAQTAHKHVLYRSLALNPDDDLLRMLSPTLSHDRAVHGVVIDDFFIFSLSQPLAERLMQRVLEAYRVAGFVVKQSKVVMPTRLPVKVIGFTIRGSDATIELSVESQLSLIRSTLAVLRARTVTGATLAHVIGRWTWVMMLRRPSLAVLQHVYRYCRVVQGRDFTLWPSVRRELRMLLGLLPLLHARLRDPFFGRAVASDASELAAGVMCTPLTPELHTQLWPLCSTRHRMVRQAELNAERARAACADDDVAPCPSTADAAGDESDAASTCSADSDARTFDAFYASVGSAPWRTLVSSAWRDDEHINALELRAVLLAVHWALSSPSSPSSRVYILLDSAVAFFSLWKGRSSSPKLLMVLRKISAALLAGGLTLLPGWVPSAVNPADAPSRLMPPCPRGRLAD